MNTFYEYGDIICSVVDSANGMFHSRVQVNGLKLSPPQVQPHIYLSEKTFSSESEALHHGMDYINQQLPAGEPSFK